LRLDSRAGNLNTPGVSVDCSVTGNSAVGSRIATK
jgi:hypothetical protein